MNRLIPYVFFLCACSLILTACPEESTKRENNGPGFDVGEPDPGDTHTTDTGSTPSSEVTDCSSTNHCVLATIGCCSPCGEPTFEDLVAIASGQQSAWAAETCDEVDPLCPSCPVSPTNPNYLAVCTAGTCEKQDLRAIELSACTSDDECVAVRAECCGCEDSPVVAINAERRAEYRRVVCDPLADCQPCNGDQPSNPTACVDGQCQVQ